VDRTDRFETLLGQPILDHQGDQGLIVYYQDLRHLPGAIHTDERRAALGTNISAAHLKKAC
jgi:hypothetical protein